MKTLDSFGCHGSTSFPKCFRDLEQDMIEFDGHGSTSSPRQEIQDPFVILRQAQQDRVKHFLD